MVVFGRQRYKIWKQFTTCIRYNCHNLLLFSDVKDTKFESNSQQSIRTERFWNGCFRTSKIQNLKAIHNENWIEDETMTVVFGRQRYKIWKQFTTIPRLLKNADKLFSDVKDTKFESNSQLTNDETTLRKSCFRTSKIQNLKAIHNQSWRRLSQRMVVFGRQRYKIWKQFTTSNWHRAATYLLFSDVKDTKFESNSQLVCSHSSF